ncbi:MAG: hypothetical protein VR70_12310 [Rhodospirillaceae bacterium BRH_c57]|nr:MAG: hypothetical protein VR70_12310 [Rhodospirillaceae bacterium BRH_c57]
MKFINALALGATCALLATPAPASDIDFGGDEAKSHAVPTQIEDGNFNLSGLRFGMSPDVAEAVLKGIAKENIKVERQQMFFGNFQEETGFVGAIEGRGGERWEDGGISRYTGERFQVRKGDSWDYVLGFTANPTDNGLVSIKKVTTIEDKAKHIPLDVFNKVIREGYGEPTVYRLATPSDNKSCYKATFYWVYDGERKLAPSEVAEDFSDIESTYNGCYGEGENARRFPQACPPVVVRAVADCEYGTSSINKYTVWTADNAYGRHHHDVAIGKYEAVKKKAEEGLRKQQEKNTDLGL